MNTQIATLDATTIHSLRQRLEQERSRLERTILALEREEGGGSSEQALALDPEDNSEMASDLTERETELALLENDRRLLAQVQHALSRIDAGLYGLSEITGLPIPLERLEAIPWATTNVGEST